MEPPAALRTSVGLLLGVDGGDVLAQVASGHEGLLAVLALEPAAPEKAVVENIITDMTDLLDTSIVPF